MNENNPFSSKSLTAPAGAMATAMESREIQEVQAAMVIAKRFPRNERQAMDRILNACTRKTLAESALYSYNRGGQEVTGPSIRLAEVLAQVWGNIQSGVRELDQTEDHSTVEAFAWDLETNARDAKVFTVPHVRHTKAGAKKLTDPRDIYENLANVGARRKRACILAIIPGDVTEAAVAQCDVTLAANADTGPDAVKRLLEAFAGVGVTKAQIEARLTNRVEAIRPAQMVALRKIYASIRDGISGQDDWFTPGTASVEVLREIQHATVAAGSVTEEQAKAMRPGRIEPGTPAPPESPQKPAAGPENTDWPKTHNGNLYDSRGVVWDGLVHSGQKSCNADGTWRRRKGVHPEQVAAAEARYPKIDPLTAFGGGPAVESGGTVSDAPFDLAPQTGPTFADALRWVEDAETMDELDTSVDAAKDVDLTDDQRQEINRAAMAQAAIIKRG